MDSIINPTLAVRVATIDDTATLLAFRRGMFTDLAAGDDAAIAASLARFDGWLHAQLARPDHFRAYLGCLDDAPVTCAMAWVYDWYPSVPDLHDQRGYILNVYTVPVWRRRGYAGQVTQACVAWLGARGVATISLHASEAGQPVYARLGFTPPHSLEMRLRVEENASSAQP